MCKLRKYLNVMLLCFVIMCTSAYAARPSHFVTPHDTIPNFGQFPTVIAVQNGDWHNPTTWNTRNVPDVNDIVEIVTYTVRYASTDVNVSVLAINNGGKLYFDNTINTKMHVNTVQITDNGTLEIGNSVGPIVPGVKAELYINNTPLDMQFDPFQYGTGILVIGGNFTTFGLSKLPAYARTTTEPLQGQTIVKVDTPNLPWQPFDRLVLPDSRQVMTSTTQIETVQLQNVTDTTLALLQPLQFDHLGAPNSLTGVIEKFPHVINVERNITIASTNPQGTRGHVFATGNSNVNIQNTRFEYLGRTTTDALDNTITNAQGAVTHIGTNHIGRYPVHLHHVLPSAIVKGNVVYGGEVQHKFKWPIAVHDTHFSEVTDNVTYNCAGACIITEQGNETKNVIKRNIAIWATGTGNRTGGGTEATGIWTRGVNNYVSDNVAINILGGTHHCGYSIFQEYAGWANIPNFSGADTTKNGQFTKIKSYTMPILEFNNNEVYSSACGGTAWWVGAEWINPVGTEPSYIDNFTAWNISGSVWVHYHTHKMTFRNWQTRARSPFAAACCNQFFQGLDYTASEFTIENSSLHGYRSINVSTDTWGQQTIKNNEIVPVDAGISLTTLWTTNQPHNIQPRKTLIKNNKIVPMPGKTIHPIHMIYRPLPTASVIRKDQVYVEDYQQIPGNNFRVYYKEQRADFVVPKSIIETVGTTQYVRLEGSPVAGLTNAQNLQAGNGVIAGEIAPCTDTTTYPNIVGIVCIETAQGGDTEIPSTPSNIVTERFVTSIQLHWKASTDNVAVNHYIVKRNNVQVAQVTTPTFTDNNLVPFTMYNYEIYTVDTSNNASSSAVVNARTLTFVNPPAPYNTWPMINEGLHDGTDVICIMQGPSAQDTLQHFNSYLQGK